MASAAKASWLANAKRIALEADTFDRKTGAGSKFEELKHEASNLANARDAAKADTIRRVHGIRLVLSDIQNKIKTNSWQSSGALRSQLEAFESKLSSFKLIMRSQFDALDESAIAIDGELFKLTTDMNTWDQVLSSADDQVALDGETHQRIAERNKVDLERRAFVGAIDRKIAALGRDGGWDPRDHDTFIRVWLMAFDTAEYFEQQLAGRPHAAQGTERLEDITDEAEGGELRAGRKPSASDEELTIPAAKRHAIVKRMVTAVPWKSPEEVDEHINWYLAYLRLSLIKKKAVAEWKQEQLHAKRQQQDDILVAELLSPGEAAAGDHSLNSSGLRVEEGERRGAGPGSSEKDRAAAKARIAKWREAQARHLEEEKEAKAKEAAAEARRQEEERRRKQLHVKEELGKWKAAETLNKELLGAASAQLQRPRSVDPAALRRRQAQDLETAKARSEKIDAAQQKKTHREKAIMEAAVAVTGVAMERDPARLLAGTKASERNKLSYEALDAAERRRSSVGAHGANIAFSARDLQYAGRATPQWIKTARSGY